jgi:hypothetical protein
MRTPGAVSTALVWLLACNGLTSSDRERLRQIEARLGDKYTFSTTDVYLEARAKRPGPQSPDECADVYNAFWLHNGAPRPDSALVYLNTYDSAGVWLGQCFWDPQAKRVAFSRSREHY